MFFLIDLCWTAQYAQLFIDVERIIGCIHFSGELALCEMQIVLSTNWTRVWDRQTPLHRVCSGCYFINRFREDNSNWGPKVLWKNTAPSSIYLIQKSNELYKNLNGSKTNMFKREAEWDSQRDAFRPVTITFCWLGLYADYTSAEA